MRKGIIRLGLVIFFLLFFIAPNQVKASELEKPGISYPSKGNKYQLDNMQVDWQDCKNADHYLITFSDLSNDNLMLDKSKIHESSYNISKSMFTYGHKYRIAVASVGNGIEEWDEVEFEIEALVVEKPEISYPVSYGEYEVKDMTVDWQDCTNAIKYTLSLRDITNDTLLIDHKDTSSSNYTINDSYFTAGHSYRLAVAAVNGDIEEWREIEFKIRATPSPIMKNFSLSKTSIAIGDTISFNGIIDSNGGMLENVTINIQGPNDKSSSVNYMSRAISGTSYNMSNIPSLEAGKAYMTSAGQYWVEVWAKNRNGEGVLVAEQTVTVITTPPPTITNFTLSKTTITLGDTVTFSGILNGNGGTLERVTINIKGPDSKINSVEYTSKTISGTSYSMSSIPSFVAGKNYMLKAGQYWVEVWAKNRNGEGVVVAEQTVTVITKPLPTMVNFTLNKTTITLGDTVKFSGILNGNGGTLEKLTINIKGPNSKIYAVEYTSKTIGATSYNMSNILSFVAGRTYMPKAGQYWIEVWAKNRNGEGVVVAEQTVTVIAPPPTMTKFTLNKTTITLGDTVTFSGTLNGNGGTLERVTINIMGPDSKINAVEYTSKTLSGTSYNLSSIPSFVAGKTYLRKAGQYWVEVWAKNKNGEGVVVSEQRVIVITNPTPTMKNFTLNKTTITLGDTVKFSGTLNGNGGTLEKVAINIKGPDSKSRSVQYTSKAISGTSYNMSNIPSFVAGKTYMTSAGQYWVEVWAKNKNSESTLITEFKVSVINVPQAKYKISGKVVYPNGVAIQGATVTLKNDSKWKQVTDSTGSYKFEGVAKGKHLITVEFDKYKTYSKNVSVANTDLVLDTIYMHGYAIRGNVYYPDSNIPMVGAKVVLINEKGVTWQVYTDKNGSFIINDTLPGTHKITIGFNGYENYVNSSINVIDKDLSLGDIRLHGYRISGIVSDGANPIKGADVYLNQVGDSKWHCITDASGYYEFNEVLSGKSHTIYVEKSGYCPAPASLKVPINSTNVYDQNIIIRKINVTINGKSVKYNKTTGYPLLNSSGKIVAPLSATLEAFGAKVTWNNKKTIAYVAKGKTKVEVPLNKSYILVNGKNLKIDAKTKKIDSKVYCSIKNILEAFGGTVNWTEYTTTVEVRTKNSYVLKTGNKFIDNNFKLQDKYYISKAPYQSIINSKTIKLGSMSYRPGELELYLDDKQSIVTDNNTIKKLMIIKYALKLANSYSFSAFGLSDSINACDSLIKSVDNILSLQKTGQDVIGKLTRVTTRLYSVDYLSKVTAATGVTTKELAERIEDEALRSLFLQFMGDMYTATLKYIGEEEAGLIMENFKEYPVETISLLYFFDAKNKYTSLLDYNKDLHEYTNAKYIVDTFDKAFYLEDLGYQLIYTYRFNADIEKDSLVKAANIISKVWMSTENVFSKSSIKPVQFVGTSMQATEWRVEAKSILELFNDYKSRSITIAESVERNSSKEALLLYDLIIQHIQKLYNRG